MRGRKRELRLKVNAQSGEMRVVKDSGMDVVLVDAEAGEVTVLNPRPRVVLEKKKDGSIVVKSIPDERTKINVDYVTGEEIVTKETDTVPDDPAEEGDDDNDE